MRISEQSASLQVEIVGVSVDGWMSVLAILSLSSRDSVEGNGAIAAGATGISPAFALAGFGSLRFFDVFNVFLVTATEG